MPSNRFVSCHYLDGEATGVVDDSLSDPGNGLRGPGGLPTEDSQGGRVLGGFAHPVDASHAPLAEGLALDDHGSDVQLGTSGTDNLSWDQKDVR